MRVLLAGLLLLEQAGTPAYVTDSPITDWLALATPEGRWAIQFEDSCPIQPFVNVVVLGEPDDPDVQLVSDDGQQTCGLAGRMKASDLPCAENRLGLCDVWYADGDR